MAPQVPIRTIYKGVMPFIAADLCLLALLVVFPGLVLWLPTLIRG
jgi:TRAP-type mannitol/chloroaromatic compound transport system permease large subunit